MTFHDAMFVEVEKPHRQWGDGPVSTFRYRSSVATLHRHNRRDEITVLLFQGRKICCAKLDGRNIYAEDSYQHIMALSTNQRAMVEMTPVARPPKIDEVNTTARRRDARDTTR